MSNHWPDCVRASAVYKPSALGGQDVGSNKNQLLLGHWRKPDTVPLPIWGVACDNLYCVLVPAV